MAGRLVMGCHVRATAVRVGKRAQGKVGLKSRRGEKGGQERLGLAANGRRVSVYRENLHRRRSARARATRRGSSPCSSRLVAICAGIPVRRCYSGAQWRREKRCARVARRPFHRVGQHTRDKASAGHTRAAQLAETHLANAPGTVPVRGSARGSA